MVKTRRSNGENVEVDDENYSPNEAASVSDEKVMNSHFMQNISAWHLHFCLIENVLNYYFLPSFPLGIFVHKVAQAFVLP